MATKTTLATLLLTAAAVFASGAEINAVAPAPAAKAANPEEYCTRADVAYVGPCRIVHEVCLREPIISIRVIACVEGDHCASSKVFRSRTEAQEDAYNKLFNHRYPAACSVDDYNCDLATINVRGCDVKSRVCKVPGREHPAPYQAIVCTANDHVNPIDNTTDVCAFSEVFASNATAQSQALDRLMDKQPACAKPPALKN